MFNLYQKAKRGLLGNRNLVTARGRVFTTKGMLGFPTYHALDADGREISMTREVAVVVHQALGVALKSTK